METECSVGLHAIPSELLLSILSLIPSAIDIFALSSTSRHFHYACLSYLFSTHSFDPFSDEIVLIPSSDGSNSAQVVILEALARSLLVNGASIKRLHCDLMANYRSLQQMIREAQSLLQYVSKLSSVGIFSLQLMHPPSSEWETVILDLLDLLPLKSCTEMELKHTDSFIWQTDPHSVPSLPPSKSAVVSPRSYVHATLRTSLERCHLQHFPPFLQLYYVELLNTSSNLTQLSIKYVYNPEDWAACIEQIRLPSLSSLSVTHCVVPPRPMASFFARHPSLSSLEFHHNIFLPSHPPRLKGAVLRNVKELVSSSDCVTLYLPSPRTLAALRSMCIIAGDGYLGLPCLEGALKMVAKCRRDIALTLEFTSDAPMLETWFQNSTQHNGNDPVVLRPKSSLCYVKDLQIDSLDGPFSDVTLGLLCPWLRLFPQMQRISFSRRCFRDPSSITNFCGEDGFVQSVGEACSSLKTFRLCGNDNEWCYAYPEHSKSSTSPSSLSRILRTNLSRLMGQGQGGFDMLLCL